MSEPITWTNEKRRLSDLIPWKRNPRQIKRDQAKRLQQSLAEFGQVEPVCIGPGNELYNGHQRLKSWAAEFGDIEIDVRVSSRALSEKEREKLTVILHAGAVGNWDWDGIANGFEFSDLQDWGFDADLLKDWKANVGALDNLLKSEEETPPDDPGAQVDKAEELREKWGTALGQLWQIGEHRLICGDCTDPAVVERVMGGEKAAAVITDPPYGQNQEGVPEDEPEKLAGIIRGAVSALPVENTIVIAFQSPRTFTEWLDATREAGHKFERMLWMYKAAQCTFPWRGWILTSESILASTYGNGEWQDVHPYSHDCYYLSEVSGELGKDSGWHGSVKPLSVVADIVARVSAPGAIVFDGFIGSGTTLVACERLGRKCRAVELDPKYVAVTLERLSQMGLEPVLISDGSQ